MIVNLSEGSCTNDRIYSVTKNMYTQVNKLNELLIKRYGKDQKINMIGISQGALIVRAYIEMFNAPKVFNFISIHGPMMGVSRIPKE